MDTTEETEDLLRRASADEPGARDALFASAYTELRRLARARLFDGGRNTCLDTTALVHESYLRLQACGQLRNDSRRAFFAYASKVMRAVIVDAVRERQALRRGGDLDRVTLDTDLIDGQVQEDELLQVHAALQVLAQADPRLARGVEMRYFGGFSETEIAEALQVHPRTLRRDWDKARLLLGALLQN